MNEKYYDARWITSHGRAATGPRGARQPGAAAAAGLPSTLSETAAGGAAADTHQRGDAGDRPLPDRPRDRQRDRPARFGRAEPDYAAAARHLRGGFRSVTPTVPADGRDRPAHAVAPAHRDLRDDPAAVATLLRPTAG